MCLNAYLNLWNVLVLLSFDDTYIFNLVFTFGFDLWSCAFISCICVFCQTLRYTCIPLESFALHANLYIWTQLCFGICVYTSCVVKTYIYLEIYIFLKFFFVDYTMRYTLELTLCQLVSLDHFNWYQYDSFLYILMFWLYVCMLSNSHYINFYWYSLFHTYMCYLCLVKIVLHI